MKLALSKIRTDGGTQPREALVQDVVDAFAEDMSEGAKFPPVTVFYDGKHYWLADGFHRVAAADKLKIREILAEVHQGTQRDAVLHSCSANSTHGQRRTNADKRRAVRILLADSEWSQWSDREIARRCAVNHETVATARRELSGGNRQIDPPAPRKATRKGTTYTQAPKRGRSKSSDGAEANGSAPDPAEPPDATRTTAPETPRRSAATRTLDRALEEGRAWMVRWQHITALAAVFSELTAVIEAAMAMEGS